MNKFSQLITTIIYLKPIQIFWRFRLHFTRMFLSFIKIKEIPAVIIPKLTLWNDKDDMVKNISIFNDEIEYDSVDWVAEGKTKLWKYHLHYFDFLENCAPENGLKLILDWIGKNPPCKSNSWEPFPISLRVVNWIQFLSKHHIEPNRSIIESLYLQSKFLFAQREFHLLANHFFKNIVALLYLGMIFNDTKLLKWSLKYLQKELNEQITNEGMHFEYSPTYHAIFIKDLMDVMNLIQSSDLKIPELQKVIMKAIQEGMKWVNYLNRDERYFRIADVNFEGCPTPFELKQYVKALGINFTKRVPERSNLFPLIKSGNLEIMLLNAPFNPKYNPGHSHCDKLSVLMLYQSKPIFVDTGSYEYVQTQERFYSRSTAAHNNIKVDKIEQAEIWDVFRTGKRGYIVNTEISSNEMCGTFRLKNYSHSRRITIIQNGFKIEDNINSLGNHVFTLYYHLYPGFSFEICRNKIIVNDKIQITLPDGKVSVVETEYFPVMYKKIKKNTIITRGRFSDHIQLLTLIEQ